jgi:Tol biopolymer transport system component/DNA-binding winged helix-turn-helix (wHTH) protein
MRSGSPEVLGSPVMGNGNGSGNEGPRALRFGQFDLDLRAGELRRKGVRVKLQDQPFQILVQLLEKPGDVVTREELRERLWPANTFVDFDHSLNAAVRRLRDALGDSAENPTFVETVARRGYRFLAPVTAQGVNGNGTALPRAGAVTGESPRSLLRAWPYVAAVATIALVIIAFKFGERLGHIFPSAPVRLLQLTANPADDRVRAAAISPDGRYLAFSDQTGFYLRQIETGETHPVAMPEPIRAHSISWFPDGTHLVVGLGSILSQTSLWEVSTLGGSARELTDEGRSPAVSPDGAEVAFIRGGHFQQQIWLLSLDGSQPRKLSGEEGDFFGSLAWSPDGSKLAFTRGRDSYGYGVNAEIGILDVHGRPNPQLLTREAMTLFADAIQCQVLTRETVAGLDGPLAWTSDGHILYTVSEPPPRTPDSNLWSVRVDVSGKRFDPPMRLTSDAGEVFSVNVASDGKRVAYLKGLLEPDVYVARVDRSTLVDEPRRLTLDDRKDIPYDWTPDGKEVIFISDRGGELNVYKQAVDQTVADLLVRSSHPLVESRLSPDGTQVLYVEYPKWGETGSSSPLMRAPLGGGTPTKIVEDNWISNHQCARAPATTCVYSVVNGRTLTFFTFDVFHGKQQRVFQLEDDVPQSYNWSLSPDGSELAITKAKAEKSTRIHLVPLRGSGERWIEFATPTTSLDWAADGRSLWAPSAADEENELLNIDLQGHVRTVWRPRKKTVGWAIPSRDGKSLALYVGSTSSNVWMMERP